MGRALIGAFALTALVAAFPEQSRAMLGSSATSPAVSPNSGLLSASRADAPLGRVSTGSRSSSGRSKVGVTWTSGAYDLGLGLRKVWVCGLCVNGSCLEVVFMCRVGQRAAVALGTPVRAPALLAACLRPEPLECFPRLLLLTAFSPSLSPPLFCIPQVVHVVGRDSTLVVPLTQASLPDSQVRGSSFTMKWAGQVVGKRWEAEARRRR